MEGSLSQSTYKYFQNCPVLRIHNYLWHWGDENQVIWWKSDTSKSHDTTVWQTKQWTHTVISLLNILCCWCLKVTNPKCFTKEMVLLKQTRSTSLTFLSFPWPCRFNFTGDPACEYWKTFIESCRTDTIIFPRMIFCISAQ